MKGIAAIVCSILFIAFFRSSFGGSSAGHQVRIVVRQLPKQMEKNTGIVGQTESDLPGDPFRINGERVSASLGLAGNSHHFHWVQKKSLQGRYCVTMDRLNEIESALPILAGNAVCSENFRSKDLILNSGEKPLVYCTVTDVQ